MRSPGARRARERNGRSRRLIRLYQGSVSAHLPTTCSFEPSCSQYAAKSYEKSSWLLASLLLTIRLVRCTLHGLTHRTRRRRPPVSSIRLFVGGACLLALALGWLLMLAGPASATLIGSGCSAAANSQNLQFNTPANPVKVKEHGTVSILGKAPVPSGTVTYSLRYFDINFASKTEQFTQGLIRTTVPVDRYATYGVGNYQVPVRVLAPDNHVLCFGTLYLVVQASPLSTTAGQAAGAGAVLGLVGLGSSLVGGMRARVPEGLDEAEGMTDETAVALERRSIEARKEARSGPAPTAEEVLIKWPWELCGFFIFSAIFLTMLVAADGGSTRAVRIRWKPRLSLVGIGSGLLLGISTIVLLQQYGVIFPTRNMGIIGLVVGLFLGVFLPTYGRYRALKKAYRRA